ncbi:transposase domain-containing protein [Streptomyces sp. NPDC056099]|uniref:transposase domain-containing protein n=1 Tax=unclassified Streptomyces TaxID=2593676 RepID=UPI0035DF5440
MAAGRFAPGHLGALTPVVPFELVDGVLSETRAVQRRLRDLPSRVGVYFLLAMCLFPEVGYRLVRGKPTADLSGMPVVCPNTKALRDLRRRLGSAPMQALFEVLAGPLARPTTPGVRFGPCRTVPFDGFSSIKVPDSERNRDWLGRCPRGGYPRVELMTLVETGTRTVVTAVFGPTREGETSYATRLLHHLGPDMPVPWDRGFDGNDGPCFPPHDRRASTDRRPDPPGVASLRRRNADRSRPLDTSFGVSEWICSCTRRAPCATTLSALTARASPSPHAACPACRGSGSSTGEGAAKGSMPRADRRGVHAIRSGPRAVTGAHDHSRPGRLSPGAPRTAPHLTEEPWARR